MLKFCSLYSGSSGNSFLVQSENINILVDAGVSGKKIVEALASLNVGIENISGILITHEHTDHTQAITTISKKYNIPIYANKKTWEAMPEKKAKISNENIRYFTNNKVFSLNDLNILPFGIPHDAADPCGFSISDNISQISIATDIGHITNTILNNMKNSKFILLESNYEPDVLKCSSYPYKLKERISSPMGHLSNIDAGKTISYLSNYGEKNIMLGHLSRENNFPELAYNSVLEEMKNNNCIMKNITLEVADRFTPSKFYEIC